MAHEPYPTPENPCYDCGSTIENHHTPLCDLTGPEPYVLDLVQMAPDVQWWDKTDKRELKTEAKAVEEMHAYREAHGTRTIAQILKEARK